MGRTVNPTTMAQVRPLVAQGLNGAQIAKALGLKTRDGRWYAQQVRAEATTNGQGHEPTPAAAALDDVSLQWIHLEGETQGRERLNPVVIRDYAEAMTEGAVFPPVVLFFDGDQTFWIGDGFHRCQAARLVGFKTIKAEVRAGGQREALLYACAANASHGLRRTNADKQRAVTTLLDDAEWGGWSNREIARHCGVSEHLVRSLRPSRSDDGQRTYTTKHGTVATMDTARIGTRAEPPIPTYGGAPEIDDTQEDDWDEMPPPPVERPHAMEESLGDIYRRVLMYLVTVEKKGGIAVMARGWTQDQKQDFLRKVAEIEGKWTIFAEEVRQAPRED